MTPAPAGDEVPPAEIATVVRLVQAHRARLITVGHGADRRSRACAEAILAAWRDLGGEVNAVVSWPAVAASWLRPASRLVAGAPDAWVVADGVPGWCGLGPRLVSAGGWRAPRTIAFAGLADPELPSQAGSEATEGLRGALPDGRAWTFRDGHLITEIGPR